MLWRVAMDNDERMVRLERRIGRLQILVVAQLLGLVALAGALMLQWKQLGLVSNSVILMGMSNTSSLQLNHELDKRLTHLEQDTAHP